MPKPTVEKLMRVLYRDGVVYDIDTDSLIRECANSMSALALFGVLSRMDDEAADFGDNLREGLKEVTFMSINGFVCMPDGSWSESSEETNFAAVGDASNPQEGGDDSSTSEHYLKLHWVSTEAAYFAFSMLDYLDAPYVQCASRKREDHMHHLRLELDSPESLDKFIVSLRGPFFVKVEESTEEIFNKAPSHAV
jgi:hypothetical protein